MEYQLTALPSPGLRGAVTDTSFTFTAETSLRDAHPAFTLTYPDPARDCYILLPACAYDGNRIRRVSRAYPPMYATDECGVTPEPLISDIPALDPDGSGEMEVTTGDMATPCVGVFDRHTGAGVLLLLPQEVMGRNLGVTVRAGRVTVSCPANRTRAYRFCHDWDTAGDPGITLTAGETVTLPLLTLTGRFDGIPAFLRFFFENRKRLLSAPPSPDLYTDKLWDVMQTHIARDNWTGEYAAEMSHVWQPGWVGGGMSSYPLLRWGGEASRRIAEATLDYMTAHQGASGFYEGYIKNGVSVGDSFGKLPDTHLHLIRKSADCLYFLIKHFTIPGYTPKPAWTESARRCADGLCRLWERYGDFGQFVSDETGDMVFGGTACGAMAPAALAKAAAYFGEPRYLDTAVQSLARCGQMMRKLGYTNGGPGEILAAPDSESAFALLESAVTLYEETRDDEWLSLARDAASLCSTWVVSYAYRFPETSEFARRGVNTVGAVFANVQNKHAAPGICTLSGDSLYRLWTYTADRLYFDLIRDIARFIPQCVSTPEHPVYSWDDPPQRLPDGCICERVNMSDWEGPACVGGVYNFSCWCETSLMLTDFELMRVYPELRR